MKWIGQNIYDQISKFRNTVDFSEDVTFYQPVNDANPTISLGKDANDRFEIQTVYNSGAQTIDQVIFNTYTTSTTNHDGRYVFKVDEVELGKFIDTGLFVTGNIQGSGASSMISARDSAASSATQGGLLRLISDDGAVMGDNHRLGVIQFKGAEDGSNTTSVGARIQAICRDAWDGSNNDADLEFYTTDGTTESKVLTLDADQLATFTGNVALNTVTSGAWQGDVIASAYLDADTAHLAGAQTFTGAKAFANGIIFEGNRTLTPGDGAFIHQDTAVITDGDTSASGTAAMFGAVNIEGARLAATNSSVTTTAAASLYVKGAPSASTNQTITNAYALWVDDGLVKFDGALTVGGTITGDVTGDVTGDLTGRADTVGTIAGLAPNTATTQGTQAAITTCANLATVGTITTGVWNGTTITKANGGTGLHGETDGKIVIADGSGAPSFLDVGSSTGITILGTVATGVWNGTKVASAYLDDDTAHLSGTQTFTGVKTFDQAINKKALFYMQTQNRFTNTTADEYYFSLIDVERDVAKGSEAGLGVVAMIPCDGILKQVILNTSSNISGQSWEWKVYRVPSGTVATSEILIATVASNAGPTSNTNKVISFVTDPEDGTNDISYEGGYDATTMFTAGDRVLFSQESNADASGSPKINIIMSFELDESTI